MSYVDVPTSSRHILIRGASGLPWPGGGEPGEEDVGGAALLTGETDGFATDFTHPVDAERVAVKTAGTVVASGLNAFFSNAGTSPKQVFDVSGSLVWSPHNLMVQSENFATSWTLNGTPIVTAHTVQDDDPAIQEAVISPNFTTIIGETYTATLLVLKDAVTSRFPLLYVASGGSVFSLHLNTSTGATTVVSSVLSATHTVTDTGTHWQLSITFVATTTTGNVRIYPAQATVMGTGNNAAVGTVTVDRVQVNRGTVPTAYLPTTTAVRNGLAIDYDPVTHAAKGLLAEPAATNLLLNNATMSTQSVTVTAAAHTLSFFGTGTVTLSGVSTAGPLVGTGISDRVTLNFTPTAGSLTCTVSGSVTRAQLELRTFSSFPSSPIPTFAATATRAADALSFLLSQIPSLGARYSIYVQFQVPLISNNRFPFCVSDGTTSEISGFQCNNTIKLQVTDGGVSVGTAIGPTVVANTSLSVAGRYKLHDCALSTNGSAIVPDTSVTMPTVTSGIFCTAGASGAATAYARIEKLVIAPRAWSDAELATRSAT